ncbi:MAG: hypothetical protein WBA97_34500 [Actinophytocola sp.]|uniref:hypothetical protein n=1 Tax=Actinophytocola sp. TaxID=1872138 RepID=UPI003C77865D
MTAPEQPDVQILLNPNGVAGRVVINGMDMGQVLDLKVHEFVPDEDIAKVTVTLLPSKLLVTVDADPGE